MAQNTLSKFLGWVWGGSCVFSTCRPPSSVPGRGLGNQAAKLWHRTVGFSCSFLFRPADPLPIGAGGVLGIFPTPNVAQDYVTFFVYPFRWYNFASPAPLAKVVALLRCLLFCRHVFAPPPLSDDVAVIFLDIFPVPYG